MAEVGGRMLETKAWAVAVTCSRILINYWDMQEVMLVTVTITV